jgi:hypothetical protein
MYEFLGRTPTPSTASVHVVGLPYLIADIAILRSQRGQGLEYAVAWTVTRPDVCPRPTRNHFMSLQHRQADGMDGRCIHDDLDSTISAPPRMLCRNLTTRSRATSTQSITRRRF